MTLWEAESTLQWAAEPVLEDAAKCCAAFVYESRSERAIDFYSPVFGWKFSEVKALPSPTKH
jgi:predicted enzyme related to lactoylglutathione lyase